MTTASIAALTTTSVNALRTVQIAALTSRQIGALTATQVVAMSSEQFSAIESADISALSTRAIAALSTTQISVMTTAQVFVLTATQLHAMSVPQLEAYLTLMGTPIVLDLNGDGVQTLSIESGIQFDLYAIGEKLHTGWISSTDGILVLDHNHDDIIQNGSELFGSTTMLASGEKAKDGYTALRELDSNGDNGITQADVQWVNLKVWVDKNSDGINQDDEMSALDSLNITKLDLNAEVTFAKNNGNLIGLTSSYHTADGLDHAMADVWFITDKNQVAKATGLNEQTATDNLQKQVSRLTQAISSFDDLQNATLENAASSMTFLMHSSQIASVAGSLEEIVNTLKQLNSNVNLIVNSDQKTNSLQVCVNGQSLVTNTPDSAKTALLAIVGGAPLLPG